MKELIKKINIFKYNKKLKKIDLKTSEVIYVNGILTTERIAMYQKRKLERLLKKEVGMIYNPTISLFQDIIEGTLCATINKESNVVLEVSQIIKNKLLSSKKEIKLIGHSNGVTIIYNALKVLEKELTNKELKKITFIALGSPFIYKDLNKNIKVEYFKNTDYPVTKINKIKRNGNIEILVYTREAKGHFLVNDYLKPLKNGEFGKNNMFYKKIPF